MNYAYLSEMERGLRVPTQSDFDVLSRYYGVDRAGWRLVAMHEDT